MELSYSVSADLKKKKFLRLLNQAATQGFESSIWNTGKEVTESDVAGQLPVPSEHVQNVRRERKRQESQLRARGGHSALLHSLPYKPHVGD